MRLTDTHFRPYLIATVAAMLVGGVMFRGVPGVLAVFSVLVYLALLGVAALNPGRRVALPLLALGFIGSSIETATGSHVFSNILTMAAVGAWTFAIARAARAEGRPAPELYSKAEWTPTEHAAQLTTAPGSQEGGPQVHDWSDAVRPPKVEAYNSAPTKDGGEK